MNDIIIISTFCVSLFGSMLLVTAFFEGSLIEIEVEEEEEGAEI